MTGPESVWKLAIFAVTGAAWLAITVWRMRIAADGVVRRCKGNEAEIRNVFYWTSSWNIGFGVETLSKRYGLSKEDTKIIVDGQLYLLGEILLLLVALFAIGGFVTLRL